jgi:SAM-dependent methyltransferase
MPLDDKGVSCMATMITTVHDTFIHTRRVRVLASRLSALIPAGARVLDVGCGDGTLACLIMEMRPDVSIEGIDVLVRSGTPIPVTHFDGRTMPYRDGSFDVVMFVDVLHHTTDPMALLREAKRVGRMELIKDHFQEGFLARPTLRAMDWLGNAHHGVSLPYNYWSKAQWDKAFDELGLSFKQTNIALGLYPAPVSWLFERGLHFIAAIEHVNE